MNRIGHPARPSSSNFMVWKFRPSLYLGRVQVFPYNAWGKIITIRNSRPLSLLGPHCLSAKRTKGRSFAHRVAQLQPKQIISLFSKRGDHPAYMKLVPSVVLYLPVTSACKESSSTKIPHLTYLCLNTLSRRSRCLLRSFLWSLVV